MEKGSNKEILALKLAGAVYCVLFALWMLHGIPSWAADIAPWGVALAIAFMAAPSCYRPDEYGDGGAADAAEAEGTAGRAA